MTEAEKQHTLSDLKGALEKGKTLYGQMRSTNNTLAQSAAGFSEEPFMAKQMGIFLQIEDSIKKGEAHLESIKRTIAYVERTDASALTQESIMDAGL